jgi:two-component system LytT family response regulator
MQKKLRTILVDDETNSNKVLSTLLKRFCPEVEIIGICTDISEAYLMISKNNPDLVFLDVQMPEGSGFDLLRKFKEVFFQVIFVTGFDQYAMNAIKFTALDYLLKPVEVVELVTAVGKAVKMYSLNENRQPQIINLLNNLREEGELRTISIHKNEKVLIIPLLDICAIEADGRYSKLHAMDGRCYTTAKTLKEFEEFLASIPHFLRINRNVIVNTLCILSYSKNEPCIVELKNKLSFDISRRKKQEVLEKLRNG